jgi:hypothetical protein
MIVRTGRDLSLRNILYPNVSGYLFIHKCPWESFGPRGQVATCPYEISFARLFPNPQLPPGILRPARTGRDLSLRNILYPNISGYLFIHKGAGIPSARRDRSRPVPTEYPLPEYFRLFVYSQRRRDSLGPHGQVETCPIPQKQTLVIKT